MQVTMKRPVLNGRRTKPVLEDHIGKLEEHIDSLVPQEDIIRRVQIYGAFSMAALLLLISIPHVANGLQYFTALAWWECWILALFIDIVLTIAKLYFVDALHKKNKLMMGVSLAMIVFPVYVSMICNVHCFLLQGNIHHIAYLMGYGIPMMVLAMTALGVWKLDQ